MSVQPGSVTSVGSRLSLRKNSTNAACIFLQNGKCAVYQSRPTQVTNLQHGPQRLPVSSISKQLIMTL